MPSFRDTKDEIWQYELDISDVRRVYRLLGIDLIAMPVDELLAKLASPCFVIDVLYCLCDPQAEARGISDEEFGRRLAIDLDPVVTDLVEAHADFFQTLGKDQKAKLIRSAIGKAKTLMEKAKAAGPAIEQAIDQMLESHWTNLDRDLTRLIDRSQSGEKSTDSAPSPTSGRNNAA